jgi:hypothetical protein
LAQGLVEGEVFILETVNPLAFLRPPLSRTGQPGLCRQVENEGQVRPGTGEGHSLKIVDQ